MLLKISNNITGLTFFCLSSLLKSSITMPTCRHSLDIDALCCVTAAVRPLQLRKVYNLTI